MSSNVVAVFGADTHISEATWVGRSGVKGDSFWGFCQLVNLARQHGVPLVIAGDCWELLHQPRPSSRTVQFMRDQIDRLEEMGLPLYYINGQHDQLASPYWFEAIHAWPAHVGGKTFKLGDGDWFGLDFFEAVKFDEVARGIPADMVGLVVHQQWREFTGSKLLSPLSLADLPYSRYVVSGDFHDCQLVEGDARTFVSPGATHMRTLSEPRTHSAALLMDDGSFTFADLKSRPVLEYSPASETDLLDSVEELRVAVKSASDQFLESFSWADGRSTLAGCMVYEPIAAPLLIVIDRFDLGAAAVLSAELGGAIVLAKNVRTAKVGGSDDGPVMDVGDVNHVAELVIASAIARKLPEQQIDLLRAMLRGEDVLEAAVASSSDS